MKYWHKLTEDQRKERITTALHENVNFSQDASLGYPASRLDPRVFYDAPFLKDAPTLQTYVANPNNIGCHTIGTSEKAFVGTQKIEQEVLQIIAEDIFKAAPESYDGYISPGGTEANVQAIWMYRNYFMDVYSARLNEIAIVSSEDTHYSIAKASNILQVDWIKINVNEYKREVNEFFLKNEISSAVTNGKKYFIVVCNMGTTMFGSVDDIETYHQVMKDFAVQTKYHVDGAYGGFVYPFSNANCNLNFEHPLVDSITIDAHKMLQAPYGTGIFLCRKGFISHVLTEEAAYVEGMDLTLCGSRSGANAVAVWMILHTYGAHGWFEKVSILQMRTNFLCNRLNDLGVVYFREPYMNIVTLHASFIPDSIAEKYTLVPKEHGPENQWYKIVVMEHVEVEHLEHFLTDLEASLAFMQY